MKRVVKGLLIAAGMMLIVGILLFIAGVVSMGGISAVYDAYLNRRINHNYQIENDKDGFEHLEREQRFAMEDVKSLDLELAYAEVELVVNPSNNEFTVKTNGDYNMYMKDHVLHVESKNKHMHHMFYDHDSYQIILEIPEGFIFDKAEIEVGASKADISTIKAKELDLKVGAGQVTIGNLMADLVDIEVGAGEIIVQNVEGDLKDYNFDIKCGAGNVDIGSESYSGLAREMHIDNHGKKNFEIECGMGNININAEN